MSKLQEELKGLCAQWYADGYKAGVAEGLLQSARTTQHLHFQLQHPSQELLKIGSKAMLGRVVYGHAARETLKVGFTAMVAKVLGAVEPCLGAADPTIPPNPPELLLSTPVGIAQNRRRGSQLEQMHRPLELQYPPLDFPGFGVGSLAASERVLPLSSGQGELSTATVIPADTVATAAGECSASKQAHDPHNSYSSSN